MPPAILAKIKQYPIGIAGAVIALIVAFLLLGRGDTITELEQQASDVDMRVQVIDFNAVNAVGLDSQLQQVRNVVEDIQNRLMDPQHRTSNLRYFLGLEEANKITLHDPFPKAVVPPRGSPYGRISYSMTLRGPLENCLQFVYQMRTGPYLISISGVYLSPGGGGTQPNDVTLRVDFQILSK